MRKVALLSALAGLLFGSAGEAAERVRLEARLVAADGAPLAQLPVRIVMGGGSGAREPTAGRKVTTDGDGRVTLEAETPMKTRRISLDNIFVRYPAQFLEIGIELDLRGRPALYWIELDNTREGTAALMKAFVTGPKGRFDRALKFHPDLYSWSIPDDPQGLMMTGVGAELKHHEMEGAPGEGWTVRLTLQKHEFEVR
jgi:hypothetical protein